MILRRKLLKASAGLLLCAPSIVRAQTLNLLNAGSAAPVAIGGGGFSTYAFTANPSAQAAPGASPVTFTSVSIGTAASNRVVVVCATCTGGSASSMTVGGVSMTKRIEEGTGISGLQIWSGTISTGTTANVVISYGFTPTDVQIVVGSFNSGSTAVPNDTQTNINFSTNTIAVNAIISAGGFAVAAVVNNTTLQTPTWANTTSGTGDASQFSGSLTTIYGAHSTTAGSPTNVAWSVAGSAAVHIVSASWPT